MLLLDLQILPVLEVADKEDAIQNKDILHVKRQLFDSKESTDDTLESPVEDTGSPLGYQVKYMR